MPDVVPSAGWCITSSKIGSGERYLFTLPYKLHLKVGSTTSQSSTAVRTAKTSPENGQLCRASLQQRLVSVSLSGCQLLSAHAQALFCLPKNWANLFSISTDQGKKKNHLEKERLNLGTLFLGEFVMDLSPSPSSRPQHS